MIIIIIIYVFCLEQKDLCKELCVDLCVANVNGLEQRRLSNVPRNSKEFTIESEVQTLLS